MGLNCQFLGYVLSVRHGMIGLLFVPLNSCHTVSVINIFKPWLAYKSKTTYPIWTNLTFLNRTDQTTSE